ncbi:hypothetical protein M3Y99_00200600 [Aphelenchoides fujianensis]|nr:hypothetical protein M3Y99_00200600 [Aphelenchoides fujianensis]
MESAVDPTASSLPSAKGVFNTLLFYCLVIAFAYSIWNLFDPPERRARPLSDRLPQNHEDYTTRPEDLLLPDAPQRVHRLLCVAQRMNTGQSFGLSTS